MSLTPIWRTRDGRLWAVGEYGLERVTESPLATSPTSIAGGIHDRWGSRAEPWSPEGGVYYTGPFRLFAYEVCIQAADEVVEGFAAAESARLGCAS